jgi:hypothetical protein
VTKAQQLEREFTADLSPQLLNEGLAMLCRIIFAGTAKLQESVNDVTHRPQTKDGCCINILPLVHTWPAWLK